MRNKCFFIGTLCSFVIVVGLLAGATVIIDPFFHYHKPLEGWEYSLENQRYKNDGILKHFDYNAIITGTSMTENFKATQFDLLFGAKTVKVPFSGSFLRETGDRLKTAFKYNNNINYVVRSLDYYAIVSHKDQLSGNYEYPTYLYDNIILNDTKYFLNKSVFTKTIETINNTLKGNVQKDFDECYNWSSYHNYGKASVLERYSRAEKSQETFVVTEEFKNMIRNNLQQNVVSLAEENPDTKFYLFFPPYSIVFWDSWYQSNSVDCNISVMEFVAEVLLEHNNIYLYSFNDRFDMICNLDNYKDLEHYGEWINAEILVSMNKKEGLLTKENYIEHFDSLREFYLVYDYDSIFK